MKTAGLTMRSVWAHRMMNQGVVHVEQVTDVDCEATVMVQEVTLKHHDVQRNFRPYLHLTGDVVSLAPQFEQPLPWKMVEVTLDRGAEVIDGYYEFTDEQLQSLAGKGYFTQDFAVPENITGIAWQLPVRVNALVVEPSGRDDGTNAPIVFVEIQDAGDLHLDLESSGYDLSEYFADHPQMNQGVRQSQPHQESVASRESTRLFTQDQLGFDQLDAARSDAEGGRAQQEDDASRSALDQAAEAITAALDAEESEYEADLAARENTDDRLYAERVAVSVQDSPIETADASEPVDDEPVFTNADLVDSETELFVEDSLDLDEETVEQIQQRRAQRRNQTLHQSLAAERGDVSVGATISDASKTTASQATKTAFSGAREDEVEAQPGS